MERRKFTREFKLESVKLIRDRGVGVTQASRDLGVHQTVLRSWSKAYGDDPVQAYVPMSFSPGKPEACSLCHDDFLGGVTLLSGQMVENCNIALGQGWSELSLNPDIENTRFHGLIDDEGRGHG
jgi:hypothetical protein